MSFPNRFAALAVAAALCGSQAVAEDKPVSTATPEVELTAEEKAERDSRKACKVSICDAFHNRKPGEDIACKVVKSFRKSQLEKMVSKAKVSWPWGRVVCSADVRLKRDLLTKALVEEKLVAEFDSHKVTCTVERDKDGPAEITAEFTPRVTFEKGKAVKASLNWGRVDGPTVIKGALWTATAADNTLGVLQSMIVDDVNDFTGQKCNEVKAEWTGR